MSRLKLPYVPAAQRDTYAGENREVTFDTDKTKLVIHDGTTPGGLVVGPTPAIPTPVNQSPADASTGTTLTPTLSASPYYSLYSVPMASARWQISTVADFSTTVVDDTASGTSASYTPSSNLDTLTTHYWRVRYEDNNGDVSAWSDATSFETADIYVDTPTVTDPADNETDIGETPTITSSAFNVVNGTDSHAASQWRVTRVSDSVVVHDPGDDTANLESYQIPAGVLNENETDYTVEVRHKGSTYGYSDWSPAITFTTAASFLPNIGDAYAGGYFVGVIDTVVGTIDSQDDYQTGLRYALVVSPKDYEGGRDSSPASGLTTGDLMWDSSTTDRSETGAHTRWNGLEATNTIIAKSDAAYEVFSFISEVRSQYPAPTISGGSEWYLPAMDELELMYRNLNPNTADNYTGSSTHTFPGSQDIGFNPSSDPTATAYTASDPSQTSVTAFQMGGAEAIDLERYWTSTDADENGRAWFQRFTRSGFEGGQYAFYKDFTRSSVRPVRRVVL